MGGGNIHSKQQVATPFYQAVDVTATKNNTATMPKTVTVTGKAKKTSTTSSSIAGVQTTPAAPWAMGGAVGAGLVALAAL